MSEAKHTPGPWLIAESVASRHAITNMRRIRSKNEGLEHGAVCDVYGIQDGSEASANASLIAAAPDLLEALQGILGYFDSGNSVSVSQATIKARSDEVKAARAAIAKATGQTS